MSNPWTPDKTPPILDSSQFELRFGVKEFASLDRKSRVTSCSPRLSEIIIIDAIQAMIDRIASTTSRIPPTPDLVQTP